MGLFDIYKTKRLGLLSAPIFDAIAGTILKIKESNLFDINNLSTGSGGVTWTVDGNTLTVVGNGEYKYQSVGYGSSSNLLFDPGTYHLKATLVSNTNTAVASRIGLRNSSNVFVGSTNPNLKTIGKLEWTVTTEVPCYFSISLNGTETNRAATVVLKDIVILKEGE